jgi:WYL_2, Sm-like SH3 beta-barrel fold
MNTISKSLAGFMLLDLVSNGKIFFVEFTKKDGTIRRMTCRRNVRKNLTGKGMSYRPLGKGFLTVYDMDKGEYRLINLLEITKFTINKNKYIVS